MIKIPTISFLIGACAAMVSAQPDSLRWNEFRPSLMTDFGHIVQGEYNGQDLEFQPLNRNTVVLEQSARYGEFWEFTGGFKAILWWPFFPGGNEPHQRTLRVDPRLSQLKARRNFGDAAYLDFGFFPYKYNPDAQNLGEYLYRSGTYPGIVRTTDGFHLMDHAQYDAYGAHFRLTQWGSLITHDLNIFAERTSIPIGDLTPGYEISLNFPRIQIGAGAAYNRFITYDGDKVRPEDFSNGYFEVDSIAGDSAPYTGVYALAPGTMRTRIQIGDSTVHALHYYTQRGMKLMARAAIDLGFLIPEAARNPGDLRVFAEAALLGVENQPFYYENRLQRIPVMFGVNVPTWRLLDLLSLQGEYYASRFANSKLFNESAYPVWNVSPGYDAQDNRRDDWKWSANARKALNRVLTLQVQVANDHLRLPEFNTNPSATALTQTPENWYYLLRLECRL